MPELLSFSKVKVPPRISSLWRSGGSDGDGLSHSRTLPLSNTNLSATLGADPQTDLHPDTSRTGRPSTINVVLFGETGVGKSSVINLIARKVVAQVSSDVDGCTMHSTKYDISFDDMKFSIFDTIGLEEPQLGVNGYLKAIERAYELIVKLSVAGGVHLLLFCMRGGRITATTQSNYRLFCECLCDTKVPIALVFTGLEREEEMEDWWTRNKNHIEHYGIKSNGHACITAVKDDTPGEDLKFTESQKRIRELLKESALQNEAFLPEAHNWFARLGKGMKSFIAKHRNPKKKDVVKVLTQRCKLDPDTAKKIAEMMERGETEAQEAQDGAAVNGAQGEGETPTINVSPPKATNEGGTADKRMSNDRSGAGPSMAEEDRGNPDPKTAKNVQDSTAVSGVKGEVNSEKIPSNILTPKGTDSRAGLNVAETEEDDKDNPNPKNAKNVQDSTTVSGAKGEVDSEKIMSNVPTTKGTDDGGTTDKHITDDHSGAGLCMTKREEEDSGNSDPNNSKNVHDRTAVSGAQGEAESGKIPRNVSTPKGTDVGGTADDHSGAGPPMEEKVNEGNNGTDEDWEDARDSPHSSSLDTPHDGVAVNAESYMTRKESVLRFLSKKRT